jgi:dipeptidyl aminopeptidase/acylaminoacyl peptidase
MNSFLLRLFAPTAIIICIFASPAISGQSAKKELRPDDYHLWNRLQSGSISDDGNWTSFSIQYSQAEDTLQVISTTGHKRYQLPKAYNGQFAYGEKFAYLTNSGLNILNLVTGNVNTIKGVFNYQLYGNGTYLVYETNTGKIPSLELRNFKTGATFSLTNAKIGSYNNKASKLAYVKSLPDGDNVGVIQLGNVFISKELLSDTNQRFTSVAWQEDGQSVVLLGMHTLNDAETAKLVLCDVISGNIVFFDPKDYPEFPVGQHITNSSFAKLSLTPSGTKVLFGLENNKHFVDTTTVQVWKSSDKYLYPLRKIIGSAEDVIKVGMWDVRKRTFSVITTNSLPHVGFNGSQTHAITYDPLQFEPQSNQQGPRDIYITDLDSGVKTLFLSQQEGAIGNTIASPGGKYIAYFKQGNWWIYDIKNDIHTNITKGNGSKFYNEEYDWAGSAPAYGNPGWTSNDDAILLYDQYDIWVFYMDGKSVRRLTSGRENKLVYRIVSQRSEEQHKMNYNAENYSGVFTLEKGMLLRFEGGKTNGYAYWDREEGIKNLISAKDYISQFNITDGKKFIYIQENFDTPPLLVYQEKNKKYKILYKSNPQHCTFEWGRSEKISYTLPDGNVLSAALFYPAKYDPKKQYPMIVHVYQKQSDLWNRYVNPGYGNTTGFNISNLTSQGYFVLLPDITFKVGNPGDSAVSCVVAAVTAVTDNWPIDIHRMGLIGQSFGGYETDYIITQTNIFTAAVAGAAITDFISGYLYAPFQKGQPNFWKYEYGQLRMGKSLFEDWDGYKNNSPIFHSAQVTTPLLSWIGEEDYQVHYYQTIEFYLALRRQGKKNVMLIYPEEGHIIVEKSKQRHLTKSIEQWMHHYLQEGEKKDWME